jgi:hypothetical protein
MAADWHHIPRGYYAIPVHEDDEPFRLMGHKLFERKAPRTYKNGRTVGSDRWRCSYAASNGITWAELREHIDSTEYGRQSDIDEVLEFTDQCRVDFGRLTGRCGFCGRTLTDPDSKMRGIGPECSRTPGRPRCSTRSNTGSAATTTPRSPWSTSEHN